MFQKHHLSPSVVSRKVWNTVTHKKEVHEISYTSGRDCDDKCYSGTGYLDEEEEDEIREALDGVFGCYKWNYYD